jgi:hypothetical protein
MQTAGFVPSVVEKVRPEFGSLPGVAAGRVPSDGDLIVGQTVVIPTASSKPPGAGLPDVNAETYPYELVQHLLDRVANVSLFATPDSHYPQRATLTPSAKDDYFGINGGYGIDFKSVLHRFDAIVQVGGSGSFRVEQEIGEPMGSFHCRCLLSDGEPDWALGREPAPTMFDAWRPQHWVVSDCNFDFGGEHGFRGYGLGRTYPVPRAGQPQLLFGAVGNLVDGFGKFLGLEGTYTCNGTFMAGLGFRGNITLRIVDPDGKLSTERRIPPITAIPNPESIDSYLVLRLEKKNRNVRTTYGPPPGGNLVSLVTPSQMRSAQYNFSCEGGGGPRWDMLAGPVIGSMDATVIFDLLAPPGTAAAPVPFTTDELYKFSDDSGCVIGTIRTGVVEGESFQLKFVGAPGQPGVRFAGFGPIREGTGVFAGIQGLLTVNSVIGIAPHALSLLHVIHIVDPEGRFRSGLGSSSCASPKVFSSSLPEDDPFAPNLRELEEHTHLYVRWRHQVKECSQVISETVAKTHNEKAQLLAFPTLSIDPAKLKPILEADIRPFDPVTFNRYGGAAKGTFKTYRLNGEKIGETVLYSYWGTTLQLGARHIKKITGSYLGYIPPEPLPPLSSKKTDVLVNSYREGDVGLTSWVEMYQLGRQQRTSFGYKLPAKDEVLWFVKDISLNRQPVQNRVFMVSHETKEVTDRGTFYYMLGMFYNIDFESCKVDLSGDVFWTAVYEEEH